MKSPIISHIISAVSRTVKNTPLVPVKNTGDKYGVREYWTCDMEDAEKAATVSGGTMQGIVDADGELCYKVEYKIPV